VGEKDFKIREYLAKLQAKRDHLVHIERLASILLKDGEKVPSKRGSCYKSETYRRGDQLRMPANPRRVAGFN